MAMAHEGASALVFRLSVGAFVVSLWTGPAFAVWWLTGVITTVAGIGTAGFAGDGADAGAAQLNTPMGVALDRARNLYVSDRGNHRIRKVNAETGVITTVAGNGVAGSSGDHGLATEAQLNVPDGIAVDEAGNLYIGDTGNNRVRKVTAAT